MFPANSSHQFPYQPTTNLPEIIPFDRGLVLTPEQLNLLAKNIALSPETSDLFHAKLYRGTSADKIQNSRELLGAFGRNVGNQGFGDEGIYFFVNEPENAAGYALEYKNPRILEGKLNGDMNTKIARITLVRNGRTDVMNGIWPADWHRNAQLRDFINKRFNVIEICGAETAGLSISSNRFIVVKPTEKKLYSISGVYAPEASKVPNNIYPKTPLANTSVRIPPVKVIGPTEKLVLKGFVRGPWVLMLAAEGVQAVRAVNKGLEEEQQSAHPYTRGIIRGLVSYVSDTITSILAGPIGASVPAEVVRSTPPLSEEERKRHLQEVKAYDEQYAEECRQTHKQLRSNWAWTMMEMDPEMWLPEYNPPVGSTALAIDDARPIRIASERTVQWLFEKLQLCGENENNNSSTFEHFREYMGGTIVPENFDSLSQYEKDVWAATVLERTHHFLSASDETISPVAADISAPKSPVNEGMVGKEEVANAYGADLPLPADTIVPLLLSGIPLEPTYQQELLSRFVDELTNHQENFRGVSFEAVAKVLGLMVDGKVELPPEQAKAFAAAIDKLLPPAEACAQEIEQSQKVQKQLETAEKEAQQAEILKLGVDALVFASYAIAAYVETNHQVRAEIRSHETYSDGFQDYIKRLGINAELKEFFNLSLPRIQEVLKQKLEDSYREGVNRWAENAKTFANTVADVRKRLANFRSTYESLNDKGMLKQLAEDLVRLQKKSDSKYAAEMGLQSKLDMGFSLFNAGTGLAAGLAKAGAISFAVNPVAGAMVMGFASLSGVALKLWGKNAQKRQVKRQAKYQRQYQQLTECAQQLHHTRGDVQQRLNSLKQEQYDLRNFLLVCGEEYLPPYTLLCHLKEGLNGVSDDITAKKGEIAGLQTQKENLAKNIGQHERAIEKGYQIEYQKGHKFHGLSSEQVLAILRPELAQVELNIDTAECNLRYLEQQQKDLEQEYSDRQEELKKPEHLRKLGPRLSLERRLRSSAAYLAEIEKWKESSDPTQRALHDDALAEDNNLHTQEAFVKLQNATAGQLSELGGTLLVEATMRIVSGKELLDGGRQKREELLTTEDLSHDAFNSANDENKEEKEVTAQGDTDRRLEQEAANNKLRESIQHDQLLIEMLFRSVQNLPPIVRKEAYHRQIEAFKALPSAGQQAALAEGEFPLALLLQWEIAAGLEHLDTLQGTEHKLFFKKICDDYRTALADLKGAQRAIEESELSPEDKAIAKEKYDSDKGKLDSSFEQTMGREISRELKLLTAGWVGDLTYHPAIRDGASLLLNSLNEFKQSNIFSQAGSLVTASNGVLQLLMSGKLISSERYKEEAVKMRLAEAFCAVSASFAYFVVGYQGLNTTTDTLQEKFAGLSPLALCRYLPLVTQGFLHPLIGAASATLQLYQYGRLYLEGKPLPLTELQSIQKQLGELPQTMDGMLNHYFKQLHSQMNGIHAGIAQQLQLTVDAHAKMDQIYDKLAQLSDEIAKNHTALMQRLDGTEISKRAEKLNNEPRGWGVKLVKYAETGKEALFLAFMTDCLQTYNNHWNGLEGTQAELAQIVQKPAPYVGYLAHAIAAGEAKTKVFVPPQLLLPLSQAFLEWQQRDTAAQHDYEKAMVSIRDHLVERLRGLCWLYEQRHAAAQGASAVLHAAAKKYGSWRANRLKAEQEQPLQLAPMDYLDMQALIERPKAMQRLVSLAAHSIGSSISRAAGAEKATNKLKEVIPAHQKRCLERFEQERPATVGAAALVGGVALGVVAIATNPWILGAAAFYGSGSALVGLAGATMPYDGSTYRLHSLSDEDIPRIINTVFWKAFAEMAVTREAPELTSKKIVDISWAATTQGLEIVKVASFCLGRIEQEHQPSGKTLLAASGKQPLLQFHTFADLTANTATVYYDKHSAMQASDMATITARAATYKLVAGGFDLECLNTKYGEISTIYGKAAGVQLCSGNFKTVFNCDVDAFKRWLGEYRVIPYNNGKRKNQWPLLLPAQLMALMDRQIQGELDRHFAKKKSLLTPSYSFAYSKDRAEYYLNVDFRDTQGNNFIQFRLAPKLSDVQLTALTGRHHADGKASAEELIAATIYMLYGSYDKWNVGYRPENEIELEGDAQTLLLSHAAPEGKSLYHTLGESIPVPSYTVAGKELQQRLKVSRRKVVKEYTRSLLLLKGVLKLAYELPEAVLKDALARSNLLEPIDYLLDGLANHTSWPCGAEVLFKLLDQQPARERHLAERLRQALSGATTPVASSTRSMPRGKRPATSPAAAGRAGARAPRSLAGQPQGESPSVRRHDFTVKAGNCLFDNVVGQLNPSLSSAIRSVQSHDLRQRVVAHMRIGSFIHAADGSTEKYQTCWDNDDQPIGIETERFHSWDEYCDAMAKDLSWGGPLEVLAMATMLKCPIIIKRDREQDRIYNPTATGKPVSLWFSGNGHYNALIPQG